MMEGKYFMWKRKNGEGNGGKYFDKENIFFEEKERGGIFGEGKYFLRGRRRTEKEKEGKYHRGGTNYAGRVDGYQRLCKKSSQI